MHLALTAPGIAFALYLLFQHRRRASDDERMRTHLVLAAVLVGAAFASTELLADLGIDVVRLGAVATFASTALLAIVSLRFQLLEERPSWLASLVALALGALAVLGYLAVFRFLSADRALLVVGTATVTLMLLAAIRPLVTAVALARAQKQRLAVLGRMSAQMAHDLKTPLAALKGAAQFLQEEHAQGRSIDEQDELLGILADEADRLTRLVDKYRRLTAFEPSRSPRAMGPLLESWARSAAAATPANVELRTAIAGDLPDCEVDDDLLVVALDNLVTNAIEAMPEGGVVTIVAEAADEPNGVVIAVSDTGIGMNPRAREQAFEEFHTTKASGTGLGLPYVRRVAEAHGGAVTLRSEESRGTEVRLYIGNR